MVRRSKYGDVPWCVVDERLVLVGGQYIPGPRLQQVDSLLVHRHPEGLGPVGGECLADIKEGGLVERPALNEVEEGLLGLLHVEAEQGLVVHGHMLLLQVHQQARGQAVGHHLTGNSKSWPTLVYVAEKLFSS